MSGGDEAGASGRAGACRGVLVFLVQFLVLCCMLVFIDGGGAGRSTGCLRAIVK